MKILQLTKREFFLYTALVALIASIVTIAINRRPLIIDCIYKYDGNLDFKNKKITYILKD